MHTAGAGLPGVRGVHGARFACQGCGFCCRFHQLGPMSPQDRARIADSHPETWWPPAAAGWSRTGPAGVELRKLDGHCVFLDADQRCALHARLGAQAKPMFCRLFPYQLVEDAEGVAIIVRDSCGGLHHGGGPLVEDSGEELLGMAREGGALLRWGPASVAIAPGWEVPLDTWMGWERALLTWLQDAPGDAAALVAGLRDRLCAWGDRHLPAPDPARGHLATRAVLMALDLTLDQVSAQEVAPSPAEAAFVADLHGRVRRAAASHERGEALTMSPPVADYARERLAHALLGKEVHRQDGLLVGLGRHLLALDLAARTADGPTLGHFAHAHSRIVRFVENRSIHHVLGRARPALHDLAVHATGAGATGPA